MPNPFSTQNLFKPEMPRIPGVNENVASPAKWKLDTRAFLAVAAVALGLLGIGGFVHLLRAKPEFSALRSTSRGKSADQAIIPSQWAAPHATQGATSAVMLSDLAKPWAAREFTFVNPVTHIGVPAMVMRLPGMPATSSSAYWAFSLDAPYETCKLAYVSDIAELSSRYHYRAAHPMVVAACDGTIYDPLRLGTTPAGAWVRGEVAQGQGIRPPISIETRVQGRAIVADRIE